MAKKMLIDAAHPEETRVVVLSGNRLEEFDFESSTKKQVKGNIYLAKVTRVEPSLQAAFVDYGGNRHGFLAFSEIHPDYYRIPVGDREANEYDAPPAAGTQAGPSEEPPRAADEAPAPVAAEAPLDVSPTAEEGESEPTAALAEAAPAEVIFDTAPASEIEVPPAEDGKQRSAAEAGAEERADETPGNVQDVETTAAPAEDVETLEDDVEAEAAEAETERRRSPSLRHYKIQEVIKRRQIMLVQVAKEERGNKGAALTTYLSLAGRYCVLMPNTARGGGVSRKITSVSDRRRLKEILEELEIPDGMGVIVRTAGAERSKAEIKRDYEYLIRLWGEIREQTLQSTAPALIYEEGNLIKRSIRDLYARDIDEVIVEGDEGYKTAKAFMRMLTPSHARRVQAYRDPLVGLFHRYQVESQIDAVHSPVAQLRSGGYLVINQTEALVAIDVNSGRATRERNIEETALRTNLEAADEIARQLRLRDLAGLIVIDFIDMEEHRHNAAVERRLKEALKNDRARIQVGRISAFGLMEMSRQRLRSSLVEASTEACPHCGGTGFVRSTESTALHVLRAIEEEGARARSAEICIYVPTGVALYLLNHKRESLAQIEARNGLRVIVGRDDALIPPNFRLERLRGFAAGEAPMPPVAAPPPEIEEGEEEEEEVAEGEAPSLGEAESGEGRRERDEERGGRRRRRRRGRRGEEGREQRRAERAAPAAGEEAEAGEEQRPIAAEAGGERGEGERRRRRRGRRGGRWRTREGAGEVGAREAPPGGAEEIGEMAGDGEEVPLAALPPEVSAPLAAAAPAEAVVESAEPQRAEPEPEPEPEPERVLETVAAGNGAASEAEIEAETETVPTGHRVPAPQPEAVDIHAVTEKPTPPRRGWWNRLIQ